LGLEQEIAAKKEATRAEVQLAIDEADQNMIVDAIAAADAQEAQKAEAEAATHRPTAQQKRDRISELEERARLFGDSAKQSAVVLHDTVLSAPVGIRSEYVYNTLL
jgi:hypothetical protein